MKKTTRKKLIALFCTFVLGSANVEKSQAIFNIFGKKVNTGFIISDTKLIGKCRKMWSEGIYKIYDEFYKNAKETKDMTFEIIDSEKFVKNKYYLNTDLIKSPDFNPILNASEVIVDTSNDRRFDYRMKDVSFNYFVEAGIVSSKNNQNNDINKYLKFLPLPISNNTDESLEKKIKNLSYDEEIFFQNNYEIIKKDQIVPTVPLKSAEEIKNLNDINCSLFKPFGLTPLKCINNVLGGSIFSYEDLFRKCPGFLVVIYSGTKDNFGSFKIKMVCSKEINDLKKKILVEYLKELQKLNPSVSMQTLCNSNEVDLLFGEIYLKKSMLDSMASISFLGLVKNFLGNKENNENNNERFYKASEVAYQIWLESRGLLERTCKNSIKNISNLFNILYRPALMYGAYKSSNYVFPFIGRKIVGGGEYTSEFLKSRNKLLNDPKKLKEAVSKMMKEGVVGLESTIESLTNLVMGRVAMSKMTDVFNKTHCQLITFIGPPGTGKSLLANKFSLALTGKPLPSWGYFTSSSVRPGVPVVDQFFDGNSELIKRLKVCKGKTVLFFDEIDKYDSRELLEKFRDAIDSGTMEVTSKEKVLEVDGFSTNRTYERVKTEKINISGLIVIFGTNEKPECWGLPPDDPNDPAENVGRTVVKRDGSMAQRFLRFKFHSFKKPEYKKMFENAFKSIVKDSKDIFGFEIVCEDNLLDKLAEESCYRMQGGRSIAVILNEMAGAITAFDLKKDTEKYETGIFSKIKRLVKTRKPKVQKVRVKFDNDTHKFEIEQVFDDTIPEVPEKEEEDNDEKDNKNADHLPPIPEVPEEDDDDNEENQGINNQQINNGIDNNVLNKQDEQQAVNSEPVEHQKDELENQKIENDKEFDNKSISTNLSNDQHESDQEEIYSYESDHENDKKPIDLEDNREEIIAD